MSAVTSKPRASVPMRRSDIPEVASIFYRAFRRPEQQPTEDFRRYFEQSFFDSPVYEPAQAGLVHRDIDGQIDSALLVIPMRVSVHGEIITGRLMSNYMTDPQKRTSGGAEMVLTIRARNQEFCFSDSANEVSADHWKAVGGRVLPIQSLDWRVVFRPARWLVRRARSRLPFGLAAVAGVLARPLDAVLRKLKSVTTCARLAHVAPMCRAAFIATAPRFVERFAVHPQWAPDELGWLLDMAARNTVDGPLRLLEIHDDDGVLCGCCAVYARPGGIARILNILTAPGGEAATVCHLLAYLDALGCVGAQGMAQPFLMTAMGRHKGMSFVPRGAYCISTRRADIVDAALKGDCYLGGLMGEDWSRLVTDFHD
jgi:hypothetical protein